MLVTTGVLSQNSFSLECVASPRGDSIMVKWMASDYDSWQYGMEVGYVLSRTTFKDGRRNLTEEERAASKILLGQFKPLKEERWMEIMDTTDRWEVLAAGTIYGELAGQTRKKSLDLQYLLDAEIDKDNRYAFNALAISHSNVAAFRMGLGYVDNEVNKNNGYLYEVSFVGGIPNQASALDLVVDNKAKELPPVSSVEAKSADLGCLLSWPIKDISSHYISYDVWRSGDGGKTFTIVNSAPVISLESESDNPSVSYRDDLLENGYEYIYKIKGKTLFERFSDFSAEQRCEGKKAIEISAPVISKIEETSDKSLEIEWVFSEEKENNIIGFKLMKSVNYDGPYEEVGSGTIDHKTRKIFDQNPLPSGYYFMEVIDINNKTYASAKHLVQLKDLVAPSVPSGVSCILDTSMVAIHIEWLGGSENDLLGYRLLTGGGPEGEFVDLVEGVIDTNHYSYPVTKKQNGETLYFSVASVDQRGNTSNLSSPCQVILTDNTPPIKPLIRSINNNDSTIIIEWATSPSSDVKRYTLESKFTRSREWESAELSLQYKEINTYLYKCNSSNTLVEFRIKAEDKGGNVVYSDIKKGKTFSRKRKEKISDFIGEKSKEGIGLSWIYFSPEEIDRFILYRAIDNGKIKTYKIISQKNIQEIFSAIEGDKGKYTYKDPSVRPNTTYAYRIRAIWNDGNSSAMSDRVIIKN